MLSTPAFLPERGYGSEPGQVASSPMQHVSSLKRSLSNPSPAPSCSDSKRLRSAGSVQAPCLHCGDASHRWTACFNRCSHCGERHTGKRCEYLSVEKYKPSGFRVRQTLQTVRGGEEAPLNLTPTEVAVPDHMTAETGQTGMNIDGGAADVAHAEIHDTDAGLGEGIRAAQAGANVLASIEEKGATQHTATAAADSEAIMPTSKRALSPDLFFKDVPITVGLPRLGNTEPVVGDKSGPAPHTRVMPAVGSSQFQASSMSSAPQATASSFGMGMHASPPTAGCCRPLAPQSGVQSVDLSNGFHEFHGGPVPRPMPPAPLFSSRLSHQASTPADSKMDAGRAALIAITAGDDFEPAADGGLFGQGGGRGPKSSGENLTPLGSRKRRANSPPVKVEDRDESMVSAVNDGGYGAPGNTVMAPKRIRTRSDSLAERITASTNAQYPAASLTTFGGGNASGDATSSVGTAQAAVAVTPAANQPSRKKSKVKWPQAKKAAASGAAAPAGQQAIVGKRNKNNKFWNSLQNSVKQAVNASSKRNQFNNSGSVKTRVDEALGILRPIMFGLQSQQSAGNGLGIGDHQAAAPVGGMPMGAAPGSAPPPPQGLMVWDWATGTWQFKWGQQWYVFLSLCGLQRY